jgi:hypothetical protein
MTSSLGSPNQDNTGRLRQIDEEEKLVGSKKLDPAEGLVGTNNFAHKIITHGRNCSFISIS